MMNEKKKLIEEEPGDPAFADVAEEVRREGRLDEALRICLRGLSESPSCSKGRLVLARIFFDMRCMPFALREVEELCRMWPENKALTRLRGKLTPERIEAKDGEETVAEADFEFDEIEMMSDDEGGEEK